MGLPTDARGLASIRNAYGKNMSRLVPSRACASWKKDWWVIDRVSASGMRAGVMLAGPGLSGATALTESWGYASGPARFACCRTPRLNRTRMRETWQAQNSVRHVHWRNTCSALMRIPRRRSASGGSHGVGCFGECLQSHSSRSERLRRVGLPALPVTDSTTSVVLKSSSIGRCGQDLDGYLVAEDRTSGMFVGMRQTTSFFC